jgi:hypothetical protein
MSYKMKIKFYIAKSGFTLVIIHFSKKSGLELWFCNLGFRIFGEK